MSCVLKISCWGDQGEGGKSGLSAGAWGRTAGHSPATWCQLLWREQGGEGVCLGFFWGMQSTSKLQALLASEEEA